MKLTYSKRSCTWAEYKVKVPDKCTVKDFLDKISLFFGEWYCVVNGEPVLLDYMLKEKDEIVLLEEGVD